MVKCLDSKRIVTVPKLPVGNSLRLCQLPKQGTGCERYLPCQGPAPEEQGVKPERTGLSLASVWLMTVAATVSLEAEIGVQVLC